jgi:hypothetical protein
MTKLSNETAIKVVGIDLAKCSFHVHAIAGFINQ